MKVNSIPVLFLLSNKVSNLNLHVESSCTDVFIGDTKWYNYYTVVKVLKLEKITTFKF